MAATRQKEFSLPPGYDDMSEGFKRAFQHARGCGNGAKASLLYAEAWADNFAPDGPIPDSQIGRLRSDSRAS